jgi:phage gp16-like protein
MNTARTPARTPARKPAAAMPARPAAQHTAAIHVLKGKLQLTDDDYRALLLGLTGKASTKDMSNLQRGQVRDHLQKLAERMGIKPSAKAGATGTDWRAQRIAATPTERKVWAMWNALHRAGEIQDKSGRALNAWVKRMVGVDALSFCTYPQMATLIEALKKWDSRAEQEAAKAGAVQ